VSAARADRHAHAPGGRAGERRTDPADRQPQFRYGVVFLLMLTLLVFEVLTPDDAWGRAIGLALAGAALAVAIGTSRVRRQVRRRWSRMVEVLVGVVVLGVATGLIGASVTFLVATALLAAIPFALAGGLLRLISAQGVTLQAVAGALTLYLVIGELFASMIAFVSHVESGPYFAQGSHVPGGVRVYYSFTTLTTTGFGDYTAAQSSGRALAVLEMLTGQLYLVTVIGLVVGNYAGRRVGGGAPGRAVPQESEDA
jgi:hypothetical protein